MHAHCPHVLDDALPGAGLVADGLGEGGVGPVGQVPLLQRQPQPQVGKKHLVLLGETHDGRPLADAAVDEAVGDAGPDDSQPPEVLNGKFGDCCQPHLQIGHRLVLPHLQLAKNHRAIREGPRGSLWCSVGLAGELEQMLDLLLRGEAGDRSHLRRGVQLEGPHRALGRGAAKQPPHVHVMSLLPRHVNLRQLYKPHPFVIEEAVDAILHRGLWWTTCVHHPAVLLAVRVGIAPHHGGAPSGNEAQTQMREESVAFISVREVVEVDKDRPRPELAVVVLAELLAWRVPDDHRALQLIQRLPGQAGQTALHAVQHGGLHRPQHAGA
mmetsp:Transcript_31864/g.81104  ORF Transcript_31864/g.81104 Transcript_31864/m.81104 type:complete len:325 (+) Transcript_31864:159-1133(+)